MKNSVKRWVTGLLACVLLLSGSQANVFADEGNSVSAQSYVLMDALTGEVLSGRNEHEQLPMASTTKILTALITLEQDDIDEYFVVDSGAIMVEGSSMGLVEGDQVSLRMLAYGMLLSSGNDAANAAAVKIAGSQESFAVMMNERAKEIGMEDSSFVTPSGLHDDNHYSTAYDMALLAQTALENEDFLEICSQAKAKVNFGNPPFDRWLSNHNRLVSSYEGCIGVKTGFTKVAGRCLVSAAERNGARFICVTLNAPSDWNDHTSLLDMGFASVKEVTLKADLSNEMLPVVGAAEQKISVKAAETVTLKTVAGESEIETKVLMPDFVYAPVMAGDEVGEIQYLFNGRVVASVPILAVNSAEFNQTEVERSFWEKVKHFFTERFSSDS